ncbi:membrane protein [Streptomyces glaucosporus]|uniref:Membrane protein n=1 Tax=Streptomyces glaucosporus TaxID=284044 RepID=A0ABN3HSQ9_9ACTN
MGIESEQLVFDYLSRIGDLAHSTSMTAAERASLVNRVRADIDRRRAEAGGADTVAGVRKILNTLGRPEEVVAQEGVTVPQPRKPGPAAEGGRAAPPPAAPPHPAAPGGPGPAGSGPEGWGADPGVPRYAEGGLMEVGGFVGGIELPELLDSRTEPEDAGKAGEAGKVSGDGGGTGTAGSPAAEPPAAPGGSPARLWRARAAKGAGVPRVGGVVELLAAALLVAGAVMGSLVPLGLGWLAAWWSPRLSRAEAKRAVMVVPGTVAAAALVWLWGRAEGRWGEPVAEGGLGEAVGGAWPWTLRAAAVASALYLVWRARRPKG